MTKRTYYYVWWGKILEVGLDAETAQRPQVRVPVPNHPDGIAWRSRDQLFTSREEAARWELNRLDARIAELVKDVARAVATRDRFKREESKHV